MTSFKVTQSTLKNYGGIKKTLCGGHKDRTMARSHLHYLAIPYPFYTIFTELSGMWLFRGSYGVYVVIMGPINLMQGLLGCLLEGCHVHSVTATQTL